MVRNVKKTKNSSDDQTQMYLKEFMVHASGSWKSLRFKESPEPEKCRHLVGTSHSFIQVQMKAENTSLWRTDNNFHIFY